MYTDNQLNYIYDRTDGHCHICCKKLSLSNYALFGGRGAWEVDHSNPRVNGGTNRLSNLLAACISCNRAKGSNSTRSQRAKYGYTRAPESKVKNEERRERHNTWIAVITFIVMIGIYYLSRNPQLTQKED